MLKLERDIRNKILEAFKGVKDDKAFKNALEGVLGTKKEGYFIRTITFSPVLRDGEDTGTRLVLYYIKKGEKKNHLLVNQSRNGTINYSLRFSNSKWAEILTTNNGCFLIDNNDEKNKSLYHININKEPQELTNNSYVLVEDPKKIKKDKLPYKLVMGELGFFEYIWANKIIEDPIPLYEGKWESNKTSIELNFIKKVVDHTLKNEYHINIFKVNHNNGEKVGLYFLVLKKIKENKSNIEPCFTYYLEYLNMPKEQLLKNSIKISVIPSYRPYFIRVEGEEEKLEPYLELSYFSTILIRSEENNNIISAINLFYKDALILEYPK
jgi:hypothetical protein